MIVVSARSRPHLLSQHCWCGPQDDGVVVVHRNVDLRPDYSMPHMACFSEQIPASR